MAIYIAVFILPVLFARISMRGQRYKARKRWPVALASMLPLFSFQCFDTLSERTTAPISARFLLSPGAERWEWSSCMSGSIR